MKKQNKNLGIVLGVVALVVAGVGALGVVKAYSGDAPKVVVEGNYIEAGQQANAPKKLGSVALAPEPGPALVSEFGLIDAGGTRSKVDGLLYTAMPATGAATTTAFMTNSSGHPILLDLAAFNVQFAGTVSSSVDISCGTSTANGIAAYTTALTAPFLQAYRMVTSSASITNTDIALGVPTTTRRLAVLANGASVICSWFQSFENGCTGATCEAVTSTKRGYTATVYAPYIYTQQF